MDITFEADWLASPEPDVMLDFLARRAPPSARKLRLFAVACCRRFPAQLLDDACLTAVDMAERYADGLVTPDEMKKLQAPIEVRRDRLAVEMRLDRMSDHMERDATVAVLFVCDHEPLAALEAEHVASIVAWVHGVVGSDSWDADRHYAEQLHHSNLLRDLFGNPWARPTFDPTWRTPTVLGLAQRVYEERSFAELPQLADALVEAGCDSKPILEHLLSPGPHQKGCFALDAVLGKL